MGLLGSILLLLSFATGAGAASGGVLVLGDSLSAAHDIPSDAGWVALLERRMTEASCGLPVVNASISGETTAGGLARLPRLLAEHRPRLLLLELGGNDGLRGQPLSAVEDNLRAMIGLAREAGANVLLLGIRIPVNYGARYAEAFAAIFARLARETEAAAVPFLLEGIATDPAAMQADGIHPTAAAQPDVLRNVLPALDPLLPACRLGGQP